MSKFVIKVTKDTLTPMVQEAIAELSNPISLWKRVDLWLHGIVTMMFREKGGKYGREPWADIAPSMADRIRMGTDGLPHGRYRDGMERPLRASGTYRRSFGEISRPRPSMMVWGSKHPQAALIPHVGRGGRFALPDPEDAGFVSEFQEHARMWVREALAKARKAGVA